ncbi:hypothetical protein AGMMS50239_32000 [Bacteroidia bacterium]|nr:hypothetical protein AGMMS50239_32000 [Bacteroidia bacterium]
MAIFKKNMEYLMLAAVCIVAFFPVLNNDFLYSWDDQWMVMNEYTEGGINIRNLKLLLTSIYHGQYAPVNQLLFLFLYNTVGYNAFYFHLTSLILHISCVCFVYTIIMRLFKQTKRDKTFINDGNIKVIAFITILIFAVHPLNVESVAWISAIKVLNYAFFYLLATLTYLSYLRKEKIIYYFLTMILFALSFGSKDQAVMFSVWILLMYYILGYDLKSKRVWVSLTPLFLLSLLFGFITIHSSGRNEYNASDLYPLWQRVVFACYSLAEYLSKFVFPYKLLYIYPFPMAVGEPLPVWLLVYPPLVVIILVTLKNFLLKKPYAFGVLFFLLHIAITLYIIPLSRFAIVADRYIYLASIGLAFIIACCFVWVRGLHNGKYKLISSIAIVCLCTYWGIFSNLRCKEWRDSDSIKKEFREMRQVETVKKNVNE